jgi:hypothetical protein
MIVLDAFFAGACRSLWRRRVEGRSGKLHQLAGLIKAGDSGGIAARGQMPGEPS